MKKVLIISAVFPPEPVVSASLSFDIANTVSEKHEVTVISPKPTRPFGFEFNDASLKFNFRHIQTDSYTCPQSSLFGRFKESYSFGKQCYKYIIENNSDIKIIYANTWPLLAQYYTVKAAKKNKIPVIIHVQDIYPESLTSKIPFIRSLFAFLLMLIDKYILRNASSIIAISEKMKNYLAASRKINNSKITVIPNWQDEKSFIEFRQKTNLKSDNAGAFTFMYMGNIGPVAGIDLLIDAFAEAELKNCRLVIAGSGSMRESLENKAKKINNAVIEFWSVPEGKVPETQSFADVLLLPLKKGASVSSIPSKLPAYMFSKKTIIACVDKNSDTADCIKKAGCGFIVESEDKKQLSQCMKSIVNLPKEELEKFGENGLLFAQKNLSKTANLEKVIAVIEESLVEKD